MSFVSTVGKASLSLFLILGITVLGVTSQASAKEAVTQKQVIQAQDLVVDGVVVNINTTINSASVFKEQVELAKSVVANEKNSVSRVAPRVVPNDGGAYQVGSARTNYFSFNDYPTVKQTLISAATLAGSSLGMYFGPNASKIIGLASGSAAGYITNNFSVAKATTTWMEYYSSYYGRYARVIYHTTYQGNTNTVAKVTISDPMFLNGSTIN